MADELKNFVDQNRKDFEMFETNTEVLWQGIKVGIEPQKRRFEVIRTWAWRVAAILVLGVGLAWAFIGREAENSWDTAELKDAETYYGNLIDQKLRIIQTQHSNRVDPALFKDLAALDSACKELKTDLKDNASNAEVVNAMIQHYRIKLKLLENILDELEEDKNENKTRHISL